MRFITKKRVTAWMVRWLRVQTWLKRKTGFTWSECMEVAKKQYHRELYVLPYEAKIKPVHLEGYAYDANDVPVTEKFDNLPRVAAAVKHGKKWRYMPQSLRVALVDRKFPWKSSNR